MATARSSAVLGLVMAMAGALLACRCAAQPPASLGGGGGSGCMPELVRLSPCMGYMSGNATAPDAACCSALSGLLSSSPRCLCMVVGGTAASLGVAVDAARVVQLPGACSVQAPPASQCSSLGVPAPSPSPSPSPSPANPTTPGGTPGSKATPSSTTQYSHGSVNKSRIILIILVAAIVALLDHF
ncbi:hypothetical protein GUJ93_ZPchr0013g35376 [Zizania palustris]|uniref:Bifunctional inhibitor/plant lipid transfer protein/seed storage helical domain-containing protein n=1 Tax=Zizania palustris TaxID=103762 RepID=A0A8J5X2P4_ZIZPA|nr:hypothetical protein GUJ93_ZPchr0013g35376 [Zizania palustris]